jgi:hypothetical protein
LNRDACDFGRIRTQIDVADATSADSALIKDEQPFGVGSDSSQWRLSCTANQVEHRIGDRPGITTVR